MKANSVILAAFAVIVCASPLYGQSKTSKVIIVGSGGSVTLLPPTSGNSTLQIPSFPNGSQWVLTESASGQTINSALTLNGALSYGNSSTWSLNGSTGNIGDVPARTASGIEWVAPSGGGGSGVPTTRLLSTTSPLRVDAGAFADLSSNRTLSLDLSVANQWTGDQTFPQTTSQGNLLVASINAGSQSIGVAHGGTGKTSLTSNRLLIGNGTSAIGEVSAGNNGDVLKLVSGAPTWQSDFTELVLSSDASNTTAAPLQEITGFSFSVSAGDVIEIEALLKVGSSNTNGITFGIDIPSGTVGGAVTGSSTATGGTVARIPGDNAASAALCSTADQNHFVYVRALLLIDTTGGTAYLKWGRGGSGTSTIYAKSRLRVKKLSS